MKYTGSDPFVYENGVLVNKKNISDSAELERLERVITYVKALELKENPVKGKFNLAHLKRIHKHLFGDLYPWAGKIRDGYLQKGEQDFMMGYRIEPESKKLFTQLKKENYLKGLSLPEFAERLAYYFGEINAIHPFREGNGRTQRVFLVQLSKEAGYELSFKHVSQEEMISASIEAHKLNYKPLEKIILNGLISL
ncbi:Fic/DOC family protein [Haemophilus haemolyticus]|uniref:protein adenylyltransferase n=1 Tax=Haemophilus haemolyticus M19501 TaxID=1028803 RepID=F9GRC5_HAEHA|nr:Fic family protein [Haemophilus haemolyticus]EGT74098.1 putative fic-like protein [Haemophilus haemolyticus M19501]